MNEEISKQCLLEVISHYDLPNHLEVDPITVGLIHQTYQVHARGEQLYILQGLHPKLSSDAILSDYEAVTTHLVSHGYSGPQLVKTRSGLRGADVAGKRWRLSTYVPGETFTEVYSPEQARIGGAALAHFHHVIGSINYSFASTHLGHKTEEHLRRLISASEDQQYSQIWPSISTIAELIIQELSICLLPEQLPRQVVHGDPKISNLRFQTGRATMIDLDTCARHTRLVDIGDAARSWCHHPSAPLGERFDLEIYKALLSGYLSAGDPFTDLEKEWLPHAGRVITLELASRFALDYLEDHYFAFDEASFSSRREHNAHRLSLMWQLAQEMNSAIPEITAWLKQNL